MRVLHTSDWHVGRTVRGRSREAEHRAVLAEINQIIRDQNVDLVLIAGDIFDHASPSATAEEIVYEALLDFTAGGAQVVMVSGNHDHPERLDAVRPLLELAHIHTGARLQRPEDGGLIDVPVRSGETARVALLPWPSRSKIVTADDLMSQESAENQGQYWNRCGRILKTLCGGFSDETVNIVLAHLVITGAVMGGGERPSEMTEDYWVPPDVLNVGAQYVALGHIHQAQELKLMWPTWYCGSPLQLDFGEEKDQKGVLVFEATAGLPVSAVQPIELKSGRRMVTARGSLKELREWAANDRFGGAFLRVYVINEPARAGLADEVRELLPNAVEVKLEQSTLGDAPSLATREGLQPRELLATYFEQANVQDEGVLTLFDELMEAENASPSA